MDIETIPVIKTAAEANAAHQRFVSGCQDAIALGEFLLRQKEKVGHGNWETWVGNNLTFDVRTVQRYIKLFKNPKPLLDDSQKQLGDQKQPDQKRQAVAFDKTTGQKKTSGQNAPPPAAAAANTRPDAGNYHAIVTLPGTPPPIFYNADQIETDDEGNPTLVKTEDGFLPVEGNHVIGKDGKAIGTIERVKELDETAEGYFPIETVDGYRIAKVYAQNLTYEEVLEECHARGGHPKFSHNSVDGGVFLNWKPAGHVQKDRIEEANKAKGKKSREKWETLMEHSFDDWLSQWEGMEGAGANIMLYQIIGWAQQHTSTDVAAILRECLNDIGKPKSKRKVLK